MKGDNLSPFFQSEKGVFSSGIDERVDVDFVRTVALVICVQNGSGEKIIGGGRYIVFGDAEPPDRAEMAFMVEEDYQGLGIASLTLRHFAGIAKDKGIMQFYAEVLPENKGMLTVFKRSGFPVRQESAEGLVHVTLSLVRDSS